MTRYFMTIPEAVQLVIRAADLGEDTGDGDVFVLEMGEPVKIIDLARNMIRLAGYEPDADIAIEFTGPRPGEQLHERPLAEAEHSEPTVAPRIVRAVRDQPLEPARIEETLEQLEAIDRQRRRDRPRRPGGRRDQRRPRPGRRVEGSIPVRL